MVNRRLKGLASQQIDLSKKLIDYGNESTTMAKQNFQEHSTLTIQPN